MVIKETSLLPPGLPPGSLSLSGRSLPWLTSCEKEFYRSVKSSRQPQNLLKSRPDSPEVLSIDWGSGGGALGGTGERWWSSLGDAHVCTSWL